MYYVSSSPTGSPEIRLDFRQRTAQDFSPRERHISMRLATSVTLTNIWLTTMSSDLRYATSTVQEYSKVLCYTCEWLVHEPVQLVSAAPVGHTLLHLSRTDMRALLAWLAIPARDVRARHALAKSGVLPSTYCAHALSASTHNLRVAALTRFYDWVLLERDEGDDLATHPLRHGEHTLPPPPPRHTDIQSHQSPRHPGPAPLFHRPVMVTEPDALNVDDLALLFAAIPQISHGHNAANRNGALIRLLLYGMLRRSELIGATWEALDDITLSVLGKGRKVRRVPIPDPATWSFVQAYTNELYLPVMARFHGPLLRQLDDEERPLTRHVLDHFMGMLRAYVMTLAQQERQRGQVAHAQHYTHLAKQLHSHIFRATGATYLAASGLSLVRLAKLLGHSDPLTTQRYYLAAEQLDLPQAVRTLWSGMVTALEHEVPAVTTVTDTLGWYRRRDFLPTGEGN